MSIAFDGLGCICVVDRLHACVHNGVPGVGGTVEE
jgi:hypothetical protein